MIEELKDILKSEAILSHYNSSKNTFFIKETDPSAKCKRVEFVGFDNEDKTIGFELDCKHRNIKCNSNHKLSPYFNNGKDLDKGNDAIIFTEIDSKNYIFICELKDDSSNSKIDKQLKSSTCFVDYLKSILKNFYEVDLKNINPIYLVFSQHGNNLRPTGESRTQPITKGGLEVFFLNCRAKVNIRSFTKVNS